MGSTEAELEDCLDRVLGKETASRTIVFLHNSTVSVGATTMKTMKVIALTVTSPMTMMSVSTEAQPGRKYAAYSHEPSSSTKITTATSSSSSSVL